MKHFLLLYFVLFIVFCSSPTLVTSQLDSCSQNVDPQHIDFDTTSLRCVAVWPDHNFILRYAQVSPNLWSFVLSFPININSYGAIGFSDDGRMEGSSAIVGWDMPAGGGIDGVKQYYLGGMTQAEVVADKGNLLYANASIVSTPTSIVYVAFQLQTNQPSSLLLFALGPQNFYPTGTQFLLLQHIDMISIDIDYASGRANVISNLKLKRSHGWLNIGGWSLAMLIGAIVARHCKEWDPLWFYLHALIQTLGFGAGIAGFIRGLALSKKVSSNVTHHKNIGFLILVLGCLQVLAILLRPGKESKVRKYWNYYHHNVGRILMIFAIVNSFYGLHLAGEASKWFAGYGASLGFLLLVVIILEIRMLIKPKAQIA
ncbi:cytochrome b561 and DOMON domain-containing protein At3g07570-like [Neltuma alba]|uniref:cytochrome b561 and DOMON domain-containing protein At3g07570-like n=1 Tax=Neltuma alba TaxID=207710 RepID=UPI0010A3E0F0|nr:cytochrome b561 and DOMON domain-containing protein At3g07570-like [Prosopis alba]